jgi:chromosome partition protein MukE
MLEPFYARFGCDLVHKTDGYFYLLPTNEKLARRHLSSSEMLVGQVLTLLYLDPSTVEHGGLVTREQVLAQLAGVMGPDAMLRAFTGPKRKRFDERVAEENVRSKVGEALRRLGQLGFVEMVDAKIRLRPALLRFAEPVRGTAAPEVELERLVASGEIVMVDAFPEGKLDADVDDFEVPEPAEDEDASIADEAVAPEPEAEDSA